MVQETKETPTLEQLKAKVAEALATGDDAAFMVAVANIAKAKSEIAKAKVEQARKEQEALAGVRQETAERIRKLIDKAGLDLADVLAKVKATGFHYAPKGTLDANGVASEKSSVALAIPQVKAARRQSTAQGASTIGKTKSEFGMSLGEVYEKFKTPEDEVKMAEASTSNSKQWQVKVAVKKRAIEAGLLTKGA